VVTTAVLNNKAVDDCGDGTQRVETIVGTSVQSFTSLILIQPKQKTYQYFPVPFMNWHQEIDSCGGGKDTQDGANGGLFPPTKFPLTFPLPDTVQELTGNPAPIQDVALIEGVVVALYVLLFAQANRRRRRQLRGEIRIEHRLPESEPERRRACCWNRILSPL
jgi:hypothetical protein